MSMSRRPESRQQEMWVAAHTLPEAPGCPFYTQLNQLLADHGFDRFVEDQCAPYYAPTLGRPSIAPGVYFRMLLVGYFEGLGSERGIAWRVADSLSLRRFLGCDLSEATPDHSSLSRIRQRLPQEIYQEVFNWVLGVLAKEGLLKGQTLAVDATTLEANAALRSVVRRDTGQGYREYLEDLARAEGIEAPTRQDVARLDKKRPRKGSNQDWQHPHDPDARITKMKDGRTHLAHKAEHAVDLDTQALVAVQVTGADEGDTASLPWTLAQSAVNLEAVSQDPEARPHLHDQPMSEVVADKGYHSNDTTKMLRHAQIRSYLSGAGSRAPSMEERPGGAGRRVCQPTADSRPSRPSPAAASGRIHGTQFRPRLRKRRPSTNAPAGPRQHPQACVPSWQRLQSGLGHAEAHRLRDPEGPAGVEAGPPSLDRAASSGFGAVASSR